jgi:hypothetical protein
VGDARIVPTGGPGTKQNVTPKTKPSQLVTPAKAGAQRLSFVDAHFSSAQRKALGPGLRREDDLEGLELAQKGGSPRRLAPAPESANTVAAFRPWRSFQPIVAGADEGHH